MGVDTKFRAANARSIIVDLDAMKDLITKMPADKYLAAQP